MSSTSPSLPPAGRLPLLPGRRRAEQFAQLLDGGQVNPSLQTDPQLAPLVDLAQALRSLPLGPAPDFRQALRKRLVAVGTVQGVGQASLPTADGQAAPGIGTLPNRINEWAEGWRVRRRFVAATAAASAVVLVGGVGLAGSRSLPGQPFYGIKRGTERVQLALAGSTEAKGERHLQFARTRLHEVASLVHSPQAAGLRLHDAAPMAAGGNAFGGSLSSRVVTTLRAMDKETTSGTKDLTTAFARSHDNHPLEVLTTFAATQRTQLVSVMPDLPAGAASQAAASLALIQRLDVRASSLLTAPTCTAACQPSAPSGSNGGATASGGDDLGPTPCSCAQPSAPPASGSQPGTGQPGPTPAPTQTTRPGSSPQPQPSTPPSSTPSPSPTILPGQIGDIISQLPVPVTPPSLPVPVPDLPPLGPVPVPTIHLPH